MLAAADTVQVLTGVCNAVLGRFVLLCLNLAFEQRGSQKAKHPYFALF